MYRADALTKTISGTTLLRDISLSCEAGESIAIIGPNGAGKTVLLKALSFADPPTTGIIEVDEAHFSFPKGAQDSQPWPWPELTFVFQQLFLWPHLTVGENIELPAKLRSQDRMLTRQLIHQLSGKLQIREILPRYPNQISGGQRQRTAIARALVLNPRWLILDEPNSALDIEQVRLLEELLLQAKRNGVAVIFSTHLLGFAAEVADRIIFIDNGEIVEEGPVDILSRPTTERMREFISVLEHKRFSSSAH